MVQPARFPTLSAGGFTASIDFVAYEETQWSALIHALSLFGHKTAVDAIRVRLRGGECGTLSCLPDTAARLVLPETFVTRTRRTGDLTHATLLRDPRTLTATSFLVVVWDGEDPARRFHRMCDGFVTTPLHPDWTAWLWRWATGSNTVRELRAVGCRAWTACVTEADLEQALTDALRTGAVTVSVPAAASPCGRVA